MQTDTPTAFSRQAVLNRIGLSRRMQSGRPLLTRTGRRESVSGEWLKYSMFDSAVSRSSE